MITRNRQEVADFLHRWLKDDADAVNFCLSILSVCGVWDDLIDGDNVALPEDITNAFSIMLVSLPNNPFYNYYKAELQPFIEQGVYDWLAANELEKDKELTVSYALRLSYAPVVKRAIYLKGGLDWAAQGAKAFHALISGADDFKAYCAEHTNGDI